MPLTPAKRATSDKVTPPGDSSSWLDVGLFSIAVFRARGGLIRPEHSLRVGFRLAAPPTLVVYTPKGLHAFVCANKYPIMQLLSQTTQPLSF